jgi:hypothetical protein
MAYCVRCGVKLEAGSPACPLCATEVNAPEDVIGQGSEQLFPHPKHEPGERHPLLDKQRKGFIELIVALAVIAIATLAITGWAVGSLVFEPWFAIGCVVIGMGLLLAPLVLPTSYVVLASAYAALLVALLAFIDAQDRLWDWSLYANPAIALFWLVAVFPWILPKRNRLTIATPVIIVAVAAFLLMIDLVEGSGLAWFLPVALPTYTVVLASLAIAAFRIRKGATVSETVMAAILVACIGVGSGNLFGLLYLGASEVITWSTSLWIVAACLVVYLTAVATIRKVRLFFTNKIHK